MSECPCRRRSTIRKLNCTQKNSWSIILGMLRTGPSPQARRISGVTRGEWRTCSGELRLRCHLQICMIHLKLCCSVASQQKLLLMSPICTCNFALIHDCSSYNSQSTMVASSFDTVLPGSDSMTGSAQDHQIALHMCDFSMCSHTLYTGAAAHDCLSITLSFQQDHSAARHSFAGYAVDLYINGLIVAIRVSASLL